MTSSSPLTPQERARRIKLLIFDVDGVLTDGGIWLFPVPAPASGPADEPARFWNHETGEPAAPMASQGAASSQSAVEAKGFSAHDGTGISLAKLAGIKCAIITRRISETVALRARDLRIEYVYMGQAYKMQAVREMMAKENLTLEEIAYVGDDVIDLPVMRLCGLAIAVKNSREQVIRESHYVTPHEGGKGAVRDAIEYVLREQGKLEQAIEDYIRSRSQDLAT